MVSHSYAVFSAQYAPHVGGVESFTQNLAHELALRGDSVTIVTNRLDDAPEHETQDDGARVVRLPCLPLMDGRLPLSRATSRQRELLDEAARRGVDRVLVNTRFYEHSLLGLAFARNVAAPAVMLDHGSDYLTFGTSAALDWLVRRYEHAMTRRDFRYRPTFAGVSDKSVEWLRTFGIDTPYVIPNAIDAAAFRRLSSERDFRLELGIKKSSTLVAFVGRLTPEKGAREAVEAARLMGDGYQFLLAGEGFLRKDLESRLPDNAHLLGNLGHPDLSALLSQADVFCLPTRSEGFCTSLLEAGAWGVPCVVPDVGGAREVLCDQGVTHGRIIPARGPVTVAEAVSAVRCEFQGRHLDALRGHVERDCSWGVTADRLEHAFAASA